jgi:deoxyribodipyrimidine photo-lyase
VPSEPGIRIRAANAHPLEPARDYVLYWMIAARRPASNHALDRALFHCAAHRRPLVIFEPLRIDYRWASARLHAFVIDGMKANAAALTRRGVLYYPYVEPVTGAGKGLLAALASRACVVVTDEFPCSFLPRMVAAAAASVDARLEVVDSNGLLPLRAAGKEYASAAHFRRFVQRTLREHLIDSPREHPFERHRLPLAPDISKVQRRWPPADARVLGRETLRTLSVDQEVAPVTVTGGYRAGRAALQEFVEQRLDRYDGDQSHPDLDATSRLSPYLHFGHVAAHEVFAAVMRHERWSLGRLPRAATGAREGWWKTGVGAEAFLDQLVVWRELAYNTCAYRPRDYATYEALPAWAKATLAQHAADRRPHTYDLETLEHARTHDPLWNAAQRQLRREGWMHNYLRMLWGKKILEWSPSPEIALQTMSDLMDRWSLDGRNPNSYAGYAWTLGRYDRPWPERPVYGKVRAMTSASAMRKLRVREYLTRYGEP